MSHEVYNKNNITDIFFTDNSKIKPREQNPKIIEVNAKKISHIFDSYSDKKDDRARVNQNFNKSSVFLGGDYNESYTIKKKANPNADYNPNAYFKDCSAYQRKVKEFYPDSEKYGSSSAELNPGRESMESSRNLLITLSRFSPHRTPTPHGKKPSGSTGTKKCDCSRFSSLRY